MEYPSIQNLYARDPETNVCTTEFKMPAVAQIARWLVTEKVDGMNIRVGIGLGDHEPWIRGRTDKAQLPGDLVENIREWATFGKFVTAFVEEDGRPEPESVVLYGEGFGPGIQKGGDYGGEKRFILFDVLVDGTYWLRWDDVVDVAKKLGIPTVPLLSYDADIDLIQMLVDGRVSELLPPDSPLIEGVVARTDPYLFDGRGNRVMFKYKVRDLPR